MEELCAELYTQEKIRGFLHLSIGQEAVVTGVMSQLRPMDNVMATYREHGHALLKGISAKEIMAEMFGKSAGCSKGRGGSMHLFSKSKRFFGGNAIVAQGIPQSVGLSMASKRLNENRITASFFGEGAMAEGVFHEALNLSSLWHFPVLFCCENNLYAMVTALSSSHAQVDLIKKAQAQNVEAISVDGMDIIQVIDATRKGIEYMGREGKPFFIEFKTYRFRPHSMFDPDLYRKKEEINMWMKKDPLLTFENDLLNHKSIDPIDLIEMDKKVDLEMEEAVRFAQSSRPSSLSDLEKDVYENNL
jgi:pyruvate dehydrogenase E1 component alpha subunit